MGKIVAIGGGDIGSKETLAIDKQIVELAETSHPKLLFIPTASDDSKEYISAVTRIYGELLGCEVDTLLLVDTNRTEDAIRQKILRADIIYVGGGDTIKMLDIWREKCVDTYLIEAYEKGVVLSGLSAGSLCWFSKGHSESDLEINPNGWWDYTAPIGVGLIPAIHCPHYNEKGHQRFDEKMRTEELPGIAVENNCALVISGDRYKIVPSDPSAKAYLLKNQNGQVHKKELTAYSFTALSDLF